MTQTQHVNIHSILPRRFYEGNTLDVAEALLGKLVVRKSGINSLGGRIVETEAYKGSEDPASHAFRGRTSRNAVMFGEAGHAYVYFTYGMYHCLNFVTEPEGKPGAVLIRALEPVFGIDFMLENRRVASVFDLTSGPGKLTKALSIDLSLNGVDLTKRGPLFVAEPERGNQPRSLSVAKSQRVGIGSALDREWRFYARGSPFLSRK